MDRRTWSGARRRDIVFTLLVASLSVIFLFLPTGFYSPFERGASERVRARILAVDNELVQQIGPVRHGSQQLEIKILSGAFSGRRLATTNDLVGKLELDKIFSVGDTAFVVLDLTKDRSDIAYANVIDHYRLHYTAIVLVVFALALAAFAGWVGIKALVSFIFSGIAILKVLLPAILHGYNPLWTTFFMVMVLAFVTIFLVGGFTRRGLVSFLGSLGGIVLTILLGAFLTRVFKIQGAVMPFTETLLYSGFDFLDLTGLFIAGIFLASSGAVMDLSMDVAAAMSEIVENNPDISRGALITSGLAVGRHVFGTMITTLLLAYTGGYTGLIMTFLAQGIPFENIINMIYVSAEFVHTMVGSFGMILVAPVTALVGGLLMKAKG